MSAPATFVLQISDPHLFDRHGEMYGVDTNRRFREFVTRFRQFQLSNQLALAAVLVSGDLVQQGGLPALNLLYEQLQTLEPGWQLWLPGNHDEPQLLQQFTIEHPDARLSIAPFIHELPRLQITGLSSWLAGAQAGQVDDASLNRLRTALCTPATSRLVALHHPPLALGSAWLDVMCLQNTSRLVDVLEENPLATHHTHLTHGHAHQFHQQLLGHIPVTGCPATSTGFMPHSDQFATEPDQTGALLWQAGEAPVLSGAGVFQLSDVHLDSPLVCHLLQSLFPSAAPWTQPVVMKKKFTD